MSIANICEKIYHVITAMHCSYKLVGTSEWKSTIIITPWPNPAIWVVISKYKWKWCFKYSRHFAQASNKSYMYLNFHTHENWSHWKIPLNIINYYNQTLTAWNCQSSVHLRGIFRSRYETYVRSAWSWCCHCVDHRYPACRWRHSSQHTMPRNCPQPVETRTLCWINFCET